MQAKSMCSLSSKQPIHTKTTQYVEQLSGSKSVFSTLVTPLRLQLIDLCGVLLVLLWLLSPLGSQASLRLLSTRPSAILSTGKVGFTNFTTSGTTLDIAVDTYINSIPVDGLYISALGSSLAIKQGPQDPFGNVKIPTYESLVGDPGETGFVPVPNSTNTDWISLLGVPMTGLDQNKRVNTSISSRYYYINCSQIYGMDATTNWPLELGLSDEYGNSSTIWDFGSPSPDSNPSQWMLFFTGTSEDSYPNSTVTNMIFAAWSGFAGFNGSQNTSSLTNVTIAECTIQPSYVDIQMTCAGFLCSATDIRRGEVSTPSNLSPEWRAWWGDLFYDERETVEDFIGAWTQAQSGTTASEPYINPLQKLSPTLKYISGDEAFPLIVDSDKSHEYIYNTPLDIFTQRMRRLFNTYWQASINPNAYFNTIPTGGPVDDISELSKQLGIMINATNATFEQDIVIFECNPWWLAATTISSCILLIVGVVGFAARCACIGPNMLGSFTSILRADRQTAVMLHDNNSTMSSMEVAKRNKDLYVALRDVRSSEDIGFIAVIPSSQAMKYEESLFRTRKLDKQRFYD
jgi:hypothetical protein